MESKLISGALIIMLFIGAHWFGSFQSKVKLNEQDKKIKSLITENDSLHSYIKRNQPVYKVGLNQLMKGK